MSNSIIAEGKTTNEAIENGLKELGVSRDRVDVKVLDNDNKKSFFSILNPRVVKVEITIKEENKKEEKEERIIIKKEYNSNIEEIKTAKNDVEEFVKVFINKIDNEMTYKIDIIENTISVEMNGNSSGMLIGYRGETLNAIQNILSAIANKKVKQRIKLILDIENYRDKREKALEELAEKLSKTVLKTGRNHELEPMTAYERKIIHSKLQNNPKIETYSIGEGENRRIVIAKK